MTTTTLSSLDIVRQFFKHMERGDYEPALALISEDCDYINPPPLGAVRGPAGIRGVLEPFFAPTLENELKVLREGSTGPVVFVERLDRHRLEKGWIELPVNAVLEVHDGKITVWREYFDLATIMKEMPAA